MYDLGAVVDVRSLHINSLERVELLVILPTEKETHNYRILFSECLDSVLLLLSIHANDFDAPILEDAAAYNRLDLRIVLHHRSWNGALVYIHVALHLIYARVRIVADQDKSHFGPNLD